MKTKEMLIAFALITPIIFTNSSAFAQVKDPVLAEIRYDFAHVTDTNHRDKPKKEEMVLYIAKNSSLYKSQSLATKTEEALKQMKEFSSGNEGGHQMLAFSSPNLTNEEIYNFHQDKKMLLIDKVGLTAYSIPQQYPSIDWQISNETKAIGGYKCQKAIAAFRGRNYTAWFTAELPFPYGPWKLNGLPGLILQAEDDKKEVVFNYAGFDKKEEGLVSIDLQKGITETTSADLARAKKVFEKNPGGNMLRNMPIPAGANVQTKMVFKDETGKEMTKEEMDAKMSMSNKMTGKPVFNNPLELSNK